MAVFVHLTPEKNINKLLKNGIKAHELNTEYEKGVFCMPVINNYITTHQWLRELKRSGQKNYVGIYFRLNAKELVYFGHFNQSHA